MCTAHLGTYRLGNNWLWICSRKFQHFKTFMQPNWKADSKFLIIARDQECYKSATALWVLSNIKLPKFVKTKNAVNAQFLKKRGNIQLYETFK